MAKISLGTYTLRARKKYQRGGEQELEYELHGYIGGRYDSLAFFRHAFATLCEPYRHLPRLESQLYLEGVDVDDRTVYGWVEAGKYGLAADLRDVDTEDLSYHRTPNDVELIRHFFLIDVPPTTERGIVILQRHGRRGVKSHLGHAIERAFSDWTNDDFLLEFGRHIPNRVMYELTRGQFRKADLVTYQVPHDRAAYERLILSDEEREEERGKVVFSLSAKDGRRFALKDWMSDILQQRRGFSEIQEELGLNPEDRIRITVDYGSGERTIDLSNPLGIRPYVEVSNDDVPLDDNGHPEREALVDFAMRLRDDLAEEIRGERR